MRAELLLVVVPFEQAEERERPAQKSQSTRARMLRAMADVQATLCAAPGRLRRIKGKRGKRGKTSITGVGGAGGEGSEEPQPYVPNWPQVRTNSNLALTEEKLE